MSELLQQIASGLASGLIYAGLALALAVVYQGTGVLNFAQGEMAAVSAYLSWVLLDAGLPFWAVLPLVLVASFALGVLVERVFIRPVAQAPELTILVVTVALFLLVNGLTGVIWGRDVHSVASPFGDGALHLDGVVITSQQLGSTAVLAVVLLLVGWLFGSTDLGLRLRAVATNPESSRLIGIGTGATLALGWGIAGAVGGVAGVLSAPVLGVSPDMMGGPLLLAFAATALGGFDSRVGAVAGGLLIGVLSNLGGTYAGLSGELRLVTPFAVIIAVLTLRPEGLFGRGSAVRV